MSYSDDKEEDDDTISTEKFKGFIFKKLDWTVTPIDLIKIGLVLILIILIVYSSVRTPDQILNCSMCKTCRDVITYGSRIKGI